MDSIRAFGRDDIPAVTRLWFKAFAGREGCGSKALQDYFRQVFFDSPWADPGLPSLLYEEPGKGVVGFLGVIPRRMTFDGRPVRVAVATQLMADSGARSYPAAKLMRRFLEGEQDLSFSDGANDHSERLWRACGGSVARLYSLKWTRVLRHAQYARLRLRERAATWSRALVAEALRPACHALDALAAQAMPRAAWLPGRSDLLVDDDPRDETLLWCIEHLSGHRALRPDYSIGDFRWLLARAREKRMHGGLRRIVLLEPTGVIAGWCLYYLRRGGAGEVLQFGARPNAVRRVLDCVFHRARQEGAVALSGGLEPRFMKELAESRCAFGWPGYAALVHSRRPELMHAVGQGDALLTRLEGEWWARFSDPVWRADEPAAQDPAPETPLLKVAKVAVSDVAEAPEMDTR